MGISPFWCVVSHASHAAGDYGNLGAELNHSASVNMAVFDFYV